MILLGDVVFVLPAALFKQLLRCLVLHFSFCKNLSLFSEILTLVVSCDCCNFRMYLEEKFFKTVFGSVDKTHYVGGTSTSSRSVHC